MLGQGVTFACVPPSWQLGLLIGFEQVLGDSPHQSTQLQCYADLQSNAASRAMTISLLPHSSALQLHTQSRHIPRISARVNLSLCPFLPPFR